MSHHIYITKYLRRSDLLGATRRPTMREEVRDDVRQDRCKPMKAKGLLAWETNISHDEGVKRLQEWLSKGDWIR